MTDATARYYQGQPTASVTTLATVPASTQWNVRQVHLVNTTTSTATITLYMGTGATVASAVLYNYSVPANSVTQVTGLFPLAATETIQGLQGTAGAITVLITGVTTT